MAAATRRPPNPHTPASHGRAEHGDAERAIRERIAWGQAEDAARFERMAAAHAAACEQAHRRASWWVLAIGVVMGFLILGGWLDGR